MYRADLITHRPMLQFAGVALFALSLMAPSPATAADRPELGMKKGQMHPDFILPTIDGKTLRLSDYRGKKVLLFHFASW